MCQKYHSNAKTNANIRAEIKSSNFDNKTLARIYNVSENTVSKWRNADSLRVIVMKNGQVIDEGTHQ